MRLKKSEKLVLVLTLLIFTAAVGLHIARDRGEEAFYLEEKISVPDSGAEQSAGKININTATAQQLQQLDGIGPALAERIVAYREANGDFRRIEDIAFVSGIGSEIYDGICEYITVD